MRVRKWFFALSESSINTEHHDWLGLIRVAIRSAQANTSLVPHMLYDGQDSDFTDEVQRLGVKLIRHRVSFYDILARKEELVKGYLSMASGAFLRIEIPLIEQDDQYVLYTDVDVVFQNGFQLGDIQPMLFACSPEFSQTDWLTDLNSGVMVMNLHAMRKEIPDFIEFIRANTLGDNVWTDQDHIRHYFAGRWDNLPIEYNWKPYWGVNNDAQIVHWHGPKPHSVRRLIEDANYAVAPDWVTIFNRNVDAYRTYLAQWESFAAPHSQSIRGWLDEIDHDKIKGWAYTSGSMQPVDFGVEIDGSFICSITSDKSRPDVMSISGFAEAGFQFNIPDAFRTEGKHTLSLRSSDGDAVLLTHREQTVKEFPYDGIPGLRVAATYCVIDIIDAQGIRGWALDTARSGTVILSLVIDGEVVNTFVCDEERADVARNRGGDLNVGFRCVVPRKFFDNEPHSVSLVRDGRLVGAFLDGVMRVEHMLQQRWHPKIISNIDGVREGVFKGWVLLEDPTTGKRTGNANLLVVCEGSHVGQIKANRYRPDVGKHYATESECGFEFLPPPEYRRGRTHAFRFYVLPYNLELDGSPLITSIVTDQQQTDLISLSDEFDSLYRQMTKLRRRMNLLIPKPIFSLLDYDTWTQSYFPNLRKEVLAQRHASARNKTARSAELVSIICPTFRPNLDHFVQAIESVIAQTHAVWELLIVDDGSNVPELTEKINQFTKSDKRIRAICKIKNGGISSATNAGIKAARGLWVAFFDHDDLLVDTALEVMLMAARNYRAKIVYSDEDKIDEDGVLSEPAFKTDWNYRMMLAVNYVSHLLLVERETLRKAGALKPKYDGAQDHALILRLSEVVDHSVIHHVPEVLYHWRRSASSTASSTGAKSYAVQAGIKAVTDHLARLGKPAEVSNIHDSTWYRVRWGYTHTPTVTIIVPFKEQIATTRECVDRLLAGTDYGAFNIILVDNWSTSPEATEFVDEMSKIKSVRVLRIEERFNYSLLNNAATSKSDAEFFVLMNNDLYITDPSWLRVIVNETLADPKVAVVGGKFLYPNGTVQHAGVVLGVGGVACHVHTGISVDDPGYAARALFPQEMSAVTAACLLIRSSVYREVGGLDEDHLKVAFNDVDLCLKVRAAGYKVVWTPDFMAEHHESLSRGDDDSVPQKEARFFEEMQWMQSRWGSTLKTDPFFSKHFALDGRPFYDLNTQVAEQVLIEPKEQTVSTMAAD